MDLSQRTEAVVAPPVLSVGIGLQEAAAHLLVIVEIPRLTVELDAKVDLVTALPHRPQALQPQMPHRVLDRKLGMDLAACKIATLFVEIGRQEDVAHLPGIAVTLQFIVDLAVKVDPVMPTPHSLQAPRARHLQVARQVLD